MWSSLGLRFGLVSVTVATVVLVTGCSRAASRAAAPVGAPVVATPNADHGERAVVRKGELELVADDPQRAMEEAAALADELHGFTAQSEIRRVADDGRSRPVWISLVLRVPAPQLAPAMERLRRLAVHVASEKLSGQDVTDDALDLDARLGSQRALEAQFLDILKRAATIREALEIHTQLAAVRGEIEKLDGRRRALAHDTELAVIQVEIRGRAPAVDGTAGFGEALRSAGRDLVVVSAGMITGTIRIAGVLLPVAVFVGVPLLLLVRRLRRRPRRT